jgi:hypothetical protein
MKALPRPSLLVLWIVRIFAIYTLIQALFRFHFYYYSPEHVLRSMIVSTESAETYRLSVLQAVSVQIVIGAILVYGLFRLTSLATRYLLGISVSIAFFRVSYHFFKGLYVLAILPAKYAAASHILLMAEIFQFAELILLLAVVWISLRPPEFSKSADDNILPNLPHPLFKSH